MLRDITIFAEQNAQVLFRMAIRMWNPELMHKCFSIHMGMGTSRKKLDIETEEEGEKGRLKKSKVFDGLEPPSG